MIGTKNLSPMVTNRKFTIALFVCIGAYFISDYFFSDAILYLVGGLLGILLKGTEIKSLFLLIWAILLAGSVFLSFRLKNKFVWFIVLGVVWCLLYLIDAFLYELLPNITSKTLSYLHMGLAILLKSTALAWIYYKSSKK